MIRTVGLSLLCLVGCASVADLSLQPEGPTNVSDDDVERDVRVPVPLPDPAFADLVSPEYVVLPGEERVWCAHARWEGDDVAFDDHQILQGVFGHHAGIVIPEEPREPGTVEDCTDAASSAKFVKNLAIATPLPTGYASRLARGASIAVQSHYINSSRVPIRVRDVVRLHRVPMESVTRWAKPFTTRMLDGLSIPSRGTTTLSIDCTAPTDGEIVLLLGHMHEKGRMISIEHGSAPDALLTSIYRVDAWKAEYRDAPPIDRHFDAPIALKAGDVLRTTCTWGNPAADPVLYPDEMCLGWGYYVGPGDGFDCVESPRVEVPPDPSPS